MLNGLVRCINKIVVIGILFTNCTKYIRLNRMELAIISNQLQLIDKPSTFQIV